MKQGGFYESFAADLLDFLSNNVEMKISGKDFTMIAYQPDKVCTPSEYESFIAKGFEIYDLMRRKDIDVERLPDLMKS